MISTQLSARLRANILQSKSHVAAHFYTDFFFSVNFNFYGFSHFRNIIEFQQLMWRQRTNRIETNTHFKFSIVSCFFPPEYLVESIEPMCFQQHVFLCTAASDDNFERNFNRTTTTTTTQSRALSSVAHDVCVCALCAMCVRLYWRFGCQLTTTDSHAIYSLRRVLSVECLRYDCFVNFRYFRRTKSFW